MSTVVFYHYTDTSSKNSIIRSGKIMPSPSGRFGPGVYGTTISPDEGRKKVSMNNWEGGWSFYEGQGKADCAFKILIPVRKVRKADSSRDIYVHDGSINLSDYSWKLLEWPGDDTWCQIL